MGSAAVGQEPSGGSQEAAGTPSENSPLFGVGTDVHLLAKRRSSLPWRSSSTVTCAHVGWCTQPGDLGAQGGWEFVLWVQGGFRHLPSVQQRRHGSTSRTCVCVFPGWSWFQQRASWPFGGKERAQRCLRRPEFSCSAKD